MLLQEQGSINPWLQSIIQSCNETALSCVSKHYPDMWLLYAITDWNLVLFSTSPGSQALSASHYHQCPGIQTDTDNQLQFQYTVQCLVVVSQVKACDWQLTGWERNEDISDLVVLQTFPSLEHPSEAEQPMLQLLLYGVWIVTLLQLLAAFECQSVSHCL